MVFKFSKEKFFPPSNLDGYDWDKVYQIYRVFDGEKTVGQFTFVKLKNVFFDLGNRRFKMKVESSLFNYTKYRIVENENGQIMGEYFFENTIGPRFEAPDSPPYFFNKKEAAPPDKKTAWKHRKF